MAISGAPTLGERYKCNIFIKSVVSIRYTCTYLVLHSLSNFIFVGYNVPSMVAPYFAVWLNSFVDKLSRAILPRIGREFRFDNKRVSYFCFKIRKCLNYFCMHVLSFHLVLCKIII